MNLLKIRNHFAVASTKLHDYRKQEMELSKKEIKATERLHACEEAQIILQETAGEIEASLAFHVADLVNTPLEMLFPGNTFDITFSTKNNSSHAAITVESFGSKQPPLDGHGGGLADVVALGLRLAVWSLGKTANFLVLDEPTKNLDARRSPIMTDTLKTLSEELGVQVLMSTHKSDQIDSSDKIYKIKLHEKEIKEYSVSHATLMNPGENEK